MKAGSAALRYGSLILMEMRGAEDDHIPCAHYNDSQVGTIAMVPRGPWHLACCFHVKYGPSPGHLVAHCNSSATVTLWGARRPSHDVVGPKEHKETIS